MAFLYLTEQGAVLKKEGERLIVSKDDQTFATLRPWPRWCATPSTSPAAGTAPRRTR
jgi:uncharacterized protein (DUF2237 family)